MEFLKQDEARLRKFRQACDLILEGLRITEIYGREDIDKNCKGVTAIKMFKGGQNIRLYCKEQRINNKNFCVIVAKLLPKKKDQKVKGKVKSLIQTVANYEYEITER